MGYTTLQMFSGNIDFSEFVRGMSVMTRGSPEEKLEGR